LYNGEPGVISARFGSKVRRGRWRATVEEMKAAIEAVNESGRRIIAGISSSDDKQASSVQLVMAR
jgi:hypothetical protein